MTLQLPQHVRSPKQPNPDFPVPEAIPKGLEMMPKIKWTTLRVTYLQIILRRWTGSGSTFESGTLRRNCQGLWMSVKSSRGKPLRLRIFSTSCEQTTKTSFNICIAREKESEDYERQLEVSKRMYGNMEQRLTSEIKLLQGKLTSLEEFRIQKDLFENQIKEAHDSLKRKDEELPMHLERMERQTVLRIETMKEEHANAIKEIAKEMEKKAITKLNETSRRALEENTMLLRQVAVVGSKLVTIESQLATSRYQNQGLKALLGRIEGKHEEATKQLVKERSKRKTQMDIEALLQRKIVQCEELEKAESELRTENVSMQKRIIQYEQERSKQQETLAEISHASEKTRDYLSKNKKKCEALSQGIQSAKRIMAAVLAADKEDMTAAMSQVVDFINEDFSS
ncbi:hypothetical protein DAPPUDRAFT_303715 [Daphnia pulex]|uniref:Cilia- and flagella-associated protein 157 n=1 Tax=Daphnia pulex TaxID=6669 RepID=E9GHI6_DAPPU|nr:hypothetical protein DAPPUDRAFT_303715 [Daphnia pulex]|eukprot:EFX81053.1 hypothetical protein DAPPUDRAFT_303715 [Daphnia pulex]